MIKVLVLVVLLQVVNSSLLGLDLKSSVQGLQRIFQSKQVVNLAQDDQAEKSPDFCNKLDCPPFAVLKTVKGKYQKRKYAPSRWITTSLAGIDFREAQSTMFMKLFKYISGNNDKGEKIAMTAPVITKLIPGQGPACESNFTMSFYLSNSVKDPPQPKDNTVSITEFPELVAYARVFPGYIRKSSTWVDEARRLAADLNGTSYNKNFFYTAGYDSPFRIFKRHNEVWFLA